MSDIVKWSGHGGISFFVKPNEIRGFKDLSISAAAETKDSTKDGEKYIQKKNSGSYVIQLTAVLSAALKVDVKDIATAITEAARSGETGYFYTGNSKLFPSSFMATEAKISNIRMNGSGVWTYCEVTWTLKQCSKYGASSSSSSSSGKKKKNKSVIFGYTLNGLLFAKSKYGYYDSIDFTKNGNIISFRTVSKNDIKDLIIVTNEGIIIRLAVDKISEMSRVTQGVRLINLREGQKVSTVSIVDIENNDNESADSPNVDENVDNVNN